MSRERYAVDVRAAEDGRLLGHINVSTVPWRLPRYVDFALRERCADMPKTWVESKAVSAVKKVTLEVAQYFDHGVSAPAFCVPAAQWEEIKDKI